MLGVLTDISCRVVMSLRQDAGLHLEAAEVLAKWFAESLDGELREYYNVEAKAEEDQRIKSVTDFLQDKSVAQPVPDKNAALKERALPYIYI